MVCAARRVSTFYGGSLFGGDAEKVMPTMATLLLQGSKGPRPSEALRVRPEDIALPEENLDPSCAVCVASLGVKEMVEDVDLRVIYAN